MVTLDFADFTKRFDEFDIKFSKGEALLGEVIEMLLEASVYKTYFVSNATINQALGMEHRNTPEVMNLIGALGFIEERLYQSIKDTVAASSTMKEAEDQKPN